MRFMRGSSQAATRVFLRKLRLRFWDFLVRMWLENAFSRLRRPEPVTLKRFFAPLFDFIFGISTPPRVASLLVGNGTPVKKVDTIRHNAAIRFLDFC